MTDQEQVHSHIDRVMIVPLVLVVVVVALVFLSPSIAENRMQACAVGIGIGLLIVGIHACSTRRFSTSLRTRSDVRPLVCEGRPAQVLGLCFVAGGGGLIVWSALFWFAYLTQ